MNISSIGSSMNMYMGQTSGMGSRPKPPDPFEKADEDDSGGLDEAEFSDLAEHLSEMTGEEVDAEALFATYDEDGDGVLSEEETLAFMEDNRPEGPPPGGMGPPPEEGGDLSEIFSDVDEDEDGYIDESEAETIAEMISDATGEDLTVEELIEAYDEDEDGVLSEEEALAALEENRPDEPPPSQNNFNGYQNSLFGNMTGIESYLNIANLEMPPGQANMTNGMMGQSTSLFSTGSFYSFNA